MTATSIRDIVPDDGYIYLDYGQDEAQVAKSRYMNQVKVGSLRWEPIPGDKRSCDWAFWKGGKLVLGEEKKSSDFYNSASNRRLMRELRGMLEDGDAAFLALRMLQGMGPWSGDSFLIEDDITGPTKVDQCRLLSEWSNIGYTYILPARTDHAIDAIIDARHVFGESENLRVLAGTDLKKRVKDDDPFVRGLRRLFDGLGPVNSKKIATYFRGKGVSLTEALNWGVESWEEAGANKNIRDQLGVMQEYD